MVGCLDDEGNVSCPDGCGGMLKGKLHGSWTVVQARTILGRCVDLKAAYRQLTRSRTDASIAIIAITLLMFIKTQFNSSASK
jgi:hypothetical protein